ncbi:hypothetical protein B0F90DRAFT_1767144 [Multifurca ochricompacta]|uniref:Uncharacterized protein n=1 Tax=Multifurca ochricompacta TaxID=376703 RepID=A0AAD4QJX8_9AGAM|nr:hypothetical protein B0F90DRAFT_1767144 [Multifurca ochricompacta]
MGTIESSLIILKEASALASKVPYIGPIASILLQALKMRAEVKQVKGDWEMVMQKVADVANVVVNVGEFCQKHELSKEDLAHLRDALQSLQRNLEGIGDALSECVEVKGIKKVLLRTDILGKVKQCDAKLSHALQLFQAKLAVRTHLMQLISERTVDSSGNYGSTTTIQTLVTTSALPKPAPQIFFGRNAELTQIIDLIFNNIGPHPARIAILGPGGYGKTTLANAVLSHERILEHFGEARYFVTCESAFTPGALLIELAKSLGVLGAGSDTAWSHIRALLSATECILCLDNFESPWDQAGAIRDSVEELLSRITELNSVTVLITIRGTERPARTYWTRPTLAPLKTLDHDAAKEAWEHIADGYDDSAEELIKAVDYVPLAVNLLAHLAQASSPALLLKEWNKKYTELIQRGRGQTHRLSNLEYSVQLSIDSERMKSNPSSRDLLGVLAMLPDGIHTKQLERFEKILTDIEILPSIRVLQQCSLINVIGERYLTHPIIRHFCNSQGFLPSKYEASLTNFYIALASIDPHRAGSRDYAEMVLEVNNTSSILFNLLKSRYQYQAKLIGAIMTFTRFSISIGDYSDALISQAVTFTQQNCPTSLLIKCLRRWGTLYYRINDIENAKSKIQEAEKECSLSSSNKSPLHATVLRDLGDIYVKQDAFIEAEAAYKRALEFHQAANNVSGQGHAHLKLGDIYLRLNRLDEAEDSYHNALKFCNSVLDQGNGSSGLGGLYLSLDKLDEAEASFKKALESHRSVNSVRSQGNDHAGLGDVYIKQKRLNEAEASYQEALKFHKDANSIRNQAFDYDSLGDIYLEQDKLNEAEASFHQALELHKAANSGQGQGNALNGLGRVYIRRSQLGDAKRVLEQAQNMHRQAQDDVGEHNDIALLNTIASGSGTVQPEAK